MRILDDDGHELPAGEVGEIAVRGPHVMAGYWNSPEQTALRYRTDASGVVTMHSGDYGWLDSDGHLYFQGRRDDLFKRHGVRVGGLEIEAVATDIPGVRAAAAVPPHGDVDLTLFVVSDLSPTDVLAELGRRLERAKVPAHCHLIDELPLTPNGKTNYHALRARLETESLR